MDAKIYLIAAVDQKNGIGFKNTIPWKLKKDMAFFKDTTLRTDDCQKRNMVLMGRKTWESLPEKHRPLEGRKNVILTRDKNFKVEGADVAHSFQEALELADDRVESIFVMGGAKVYEQVMKRKDIKGVYLTRIQRTYKCDAFFPKLPRFPKQELLGSEVEDGVKYEFWLYKKPAPKWRG